MQTDRPYRCGSPGQDRDGEIGLAGNYIGTRREILGTLTMLNKLCLPPLDTRSPNMAMGDIMARNKVNDDNSSNVGSLPVTDDDSPNIVQRFQVGCLQITAQTPPEQWPTSLVKGSPKHKAAIVNCACTPDVEVGHEWSEPFRVVDWLIMVRESVDEKTGEIKEYPWLALICDNGAVVGTSSQVVPHQLARMLRAYTEEEWRKGIPMKIRRRMSRGGGRSYHELRVAQ